MTTQTPPHQRRIGRSGRWLAGAAVCAIGLSALAAPGGAGAMTPALPPSAERTAERVQDFGSHALPVGPWRDGSLPVQQTEGAVTQTAWRIRQSGASTLDLLAPLRTQAAAAGYKTLFECDTLACGGFDFRYGTDTLPEPQMHVDLGDFRYFAAKRAADSGTEYIGILVSRSATQGFVHITRIGPADRPAPDLSASTKSQIDPAETAAVTTPDPDALILTDAQPFVLEDLAFGSGSGDLAPGDYASVARVQDWLRANPDRHIVLVGHTDASGNADANTALSLARAQAVRDRLLQDGTIDPARITATGAGPSQPRADNATAEGRQKNRRVEVTLTPTL